MPNTKETIEYALHAYDTFWEYYRKTLDERNQILNNYMVFVGIPISIFCVFIEKLNIYANRYLIFIIMFMIIIFVLGIVIYNTYIVECFISERYLNKIKNITRYLIDNFDTDYENVFENTYNLDDLLLDKNNLKMQRANKSSIIIADNTLIMIAIVILSFKDNISGWHVFWGVFISSMIHVAIFIYQKQYR